MTERRDTCGAERRVRQRLRTATPGTVVYDNGTRSVACTVRNTTDHGARIKLQDKVTLGEFFQLHAPDAFAEPVQCKLIWRRGPLVGVQFCAPLEGGAQASLPDIDARLKEYGDRLAEHLGYRSHKGLDAVHYYLICKHGWPPARVRELTAEDLEFLVREDVAALD